MVAGAPASCAVVFASVGPPPGLPSAWADAPPPKQPADRPGNARPSGRRGSDAMRLLANLPRGAGCLRGSEGLPILLTTEFVSKVVGSSAKTRAPQVDAPRPEPLPPPEPWDPSTTSIMLRNVPNRYSFEELLLEMILRGLIGTFDFLYLPIDFHTKKNRGYAFINLTTPDHAGRFRRAFHGQQLKMYSTKKVLELVPATVQGFAGLANSFTRKKAGLVKNPWFRPMVFAVSSGGVTWDALRRESSIVADRQVLWERVRMDGVLASAGGQPRSAEAGGRGDDRELDRESSIVADRQVLWERVRMDGVLASAGGQPRSAEAGGRGDDHGPDSENSDDDTLEPMQRLQMAVRRFLRRCDAE